MKTMINWVFFQKKISIGILHCDVTLFTCASPTFASPWMVSCEIIYPHAREFLNGKSNSLFFLQLLPIN